MKYFKTPTVKDIFALLIIKMIGFILFFFWLSLGPLQLIFLVSGIESAQSVLSVSSSYDLSHKLSDFYEKNSAFLLGASLVLCFTPMFGEIYIRRYAVKNRTFKILKYIVISNQIFFKAIILIFIYFLVFIYGTVFLLSSKDNYLISIKTEMVQNFDKLLEKEEKIDLIKDEYFSNENKEDERKYIASIGFGLYHSCKNNEPALFHPNNFDNYNAYIKVKCEKYTGDMYNFEYEIISRENFEKEGE